MKRFCPRASSDPLPIDLLSFRRERFWREETIFTDARSSQQ
jgi:hypothetical protein